MPAERLEMRRVREILRHRFEEGLGHKAIALRVGAAPSTVRETLRRAEAAGLSWPLGRMRSPMRFWRRRSTRRPGRRRAIAAASSRIGRMFIAS